MSFTFFMLFYPCMQQKLGYDVNICTYNSRAQVCATAATTTILKLLEIVFELRCAYIVVDAKLDMTKQFLFRRELMLLTEFFSSPLHIKNVM